MTIYQAKIDHIPGSSAPDEYDTSEGLIPPDDFVVSRTIDGEPLSFYADLKWDRTYYDPDHKEFNLYFDYWRNGPHPDISITIDQLPQSRAEPVRTIQWVMFTLIYRREGASLSNGSLANYCAMLCGLARTADVKSIGLRNLLGNSNGLLEYAKANNNQAKILCALLKHLRWLGKESNGLNIIPSKVVSTIGEIGKRWAKDHRQHPPMPTAIYDFVLKVLGTEIDRMFEVSDRLLQLWKVCAKDPAMGRHISNQKLANKRYELDDSPPRPEFCDLLTHYELDKYWEENRLPANIQGLWKSLCEMQVACVLQIQAFTGMRAHEAETLPHFCLEEAKMNGETHYFVNGRVTKLTGGKIKRVQWVTSDSGRKAILLAQRLSQAIYELAGIPLKNDTEHINQCYLFVTATFGQVHAQGKNQPANLYLSRQPRLRSLLQPIITRSDIRELEQIDPERDWQAEKQFQIGSEWQLTSHQFRRSLALWGHASGLISLPSLRRQLQHITREMSMYYARGSQFATRFINSDFGEERHFGEEWQEMEPEAQFLGYLNNVILPAAEERTGAHARWVDKNLRGEGGTILFDRDATERRFESGEMAYRETFAGGCTRVGGPCEKSGIDPMNLQCIIDDCKNLVLNMAKFQRVIRIQMVFVDTLKNKGVDLPETRIEAENLEKLKVKLEKIQADNPAQLPTNQMVA